MINEFRGEYFFLSNFYESPVEYLGITYQNNEAAFQSMKTFRPDEREKFSSINPSDAKKAGRKVKLRTDWEEVKDSCMYGICFAKFQQNPELKQLLLNTGEEYLEEGNLWGDKVWGTVNGDGENKLGKILMQVREKLRGEK